MRLAPYLALLLVAVGCGGQSTIQRDDDGRGGASGSGMASGGTAVAIGGTTGASGSPNGGTSGAPPCDPVIFVDVCVFSCFTDEANFTDRRCVAGRWQCPDGSMPQNDCPSESCAGSHTHCCAENGAATYRECDEAGVRRGCMGAAERPIAFSDACVPPGYDVSRCFELEGQPCVPLGLRCDEGALWCLCVSNALTGAGSWECFEPV